MRMIIAADVLLAGFSSVTSAQTMQDAPKIMVDGYGEATTVPDLAILSYSVRGEGTTSDDAVRTMTAAGARIEASLQRIDAAAKPTTSGVRVAPVRASACKDRDYDNDDEQLSKGVCAIIGYVATQSVELRTLQVNAAGTMVGVAGRGGALNSQLSRWDLKDPREAKGRAIAAAFADAQAKATALAAGSHVTLGPILTLATTNRDAVRTEDLIAGLPQANRLSAERDEPVQVKLTPEPITTSANVTVTYAIAR